MPTEDRIVIASTKATIVLEDFDIEFKEDIFDLIISIQLEREKLGKETSEAQLGLLLSNFLNERWSEHLGENKLGPGDGLKVMRPILKQAEVIKKNLEDAVK